MGFVVRGCEISGGVNASLPSCVSHNCPNHAALPQRAGHCAIHAKLDADALNCIN
jgi:hypothetical protein